jgi:hypothetical protein
MRRSTALLTTLLLSAGAAVVPLAATPATADSLPAGSCSQVRGDLDAIGVPVIAGGALAGFHVVVTSTRGDLAAATITADLTVVRAGAGGALQLVGTHHFLDATTGLDLTTDDFVRISPGGVVNDTLLVVAGGTGRLHTHGTVDLATGAVHLTYAGRVCT